MPKIIGNTKGITLDKDGQPQVDNSFEGPAYVVQDMGLGIEEKVISLTREGDRLKQNTPLKGLTSTMDLSS